MVNNNLTALTLPHTRQEKRPGEEVGAGEESTIVAAAAAAEVPTACSSGFFTP